MGLRIAAGPINAPEVGARGKPPSAPWEPLGAAEDGDGYLSFFHSDPTSPFAVREVTRPRDNKSDPNVETGTYGLFSTCERAMRAGIVRERRPHLFFVTRRGKTRVLAGYYEIGWKARAKPLPAAWNGKRFLDDYALAANRVHFIDPPIPLTEVADSLGDPSLAKSFRLCKRVDAEVARALRDLLLRRKDRTAEYIDDIHRLERVNKRFTGFRYVNWREESEFSWAKSLEFLSDATTDLVLAEVGKLQGHGVEQWECLSCHEVTDSVSPLRRCAHCKAVGTQIPRGVR